MDVLPLSFLPHLGLMKVVYSMAKRHKNPFFVLSNPCHILANRAIFAMHISWHCTNQRTNRGNSLSGCPRLFYQPAFNSFYELEKPYIKSHFFWQHGKLPGLFIPKIFIFHTTT